MSDPFQILGHNLRVAEREAYHVLKRVSHPADLLSSYFPKQVEDQTSWIEWAKYKLFGMHQEVDFKLKDARNQVIKEHLVATEALEQLDLEAEDKEEIQKQFDELSFMRTQLIETTRQVNGTAAATKMGMAALVAASAIGLFSKMIYDVGYCSMHSSYPAVQALYTASCPNPLVNPFYLVSGVFAVALPALALMQTLSLLHDAGYLDSLFSYPLRTCNELSIEVIEKASRIKERVIKIYQNSIKPETEAA